MAQISALGSQLGLLRDAALAHQLAPGRSASEEETSEWYFLSARMSHLS